MIKSITTSLLLTLGMLGTALAQQAEEPKKPAPLLAKLHFLNGDSFSGEIVKWDTENIQIKSKYLVDVASFPSSTLLDVTLESDGIPVIQENDPNASEKAITTIKINNRYNMSEQHDVLKGEFKQIDDNTITINTPYAGELVINRNMINKMWIETEKGYIYNGPNSLEEWHNTEPSKAWKFENDSLVATATASISKDIKLPNRAVFSFDYEWKGNPYFSIKLFSSDYEMSRPDFHYEFVSRYGSQYMQKVFENRTTRLPAKQQEVNRIFLNRNMRSSEEKSAHYDIYMDKTKGAFHIYRNGKFYATFTDPQPKPEKFGTAIHLYNHNNAQSKVSKIRVTAWNGNLPKDTDNSALNELKGKGQKVLLRNGDAVLGKVGAIKNGYIEVVTEFGPLKIPVIGMRTIDLSGSEKHKPKRYKEDIKAWFNNQEWIILKPISINGNKLKAYHQAFGEKEFDLRAFQKIDLHINNEKINALRKNDNW